MLYALLAIALLGWGLWPICDKKALQYAMHPIVIGVVYSVTSLIFDMAALFVGSKFGNITWKLNTGAIWLVVGSTVSCFAMLAYTYAMQRTDANVVVAITSAYPLVTLVASVFILNETVTWQRGLGVALIAVGVFFVGR